MLKSNIKTVRHDMNAMMRDAQDLFHEAAAATGERAEELRARGLALLDAAVDKAQDVQAAAIEKGKEVAQTTDEFVHEHPWQAVAISAGAGLLVGLLISRR